LVGFYKSLPNYLLIYGNYLLFGREFLKIQDRTIGGKSMKKFGVTVLIIVIILAVLAAKIYLSHKEMPQFSLIQIGNAISDHDLEKFSRFVDLESVAASIVEEFFASIDFNREPALIRSLKKELESGIAQEIKGYVATGELKTPNRVFSRDAKDIMSALTMTKDNINQFKSISYIKRSKKAARAGLNFISERVSSIILQLELQKQPSGWKLVRINNYTEIRAKLHQREQQKHIKIEDMLFQGAKNSVIWGRFDREEVFLDLKETGIKGWPASLFIDVDEAGQLSLNLTDGRNKISLAMDPGKAEAFDADRKLNEHYYVQAGEYDFDNDGRPEIVIAIGDNSIDLVVNVFRFDPPKNNTEVLTLQNWKLVGVLMGQDKAYLNGRRIKLPYTAMNFYKEFQWEKNGFKEVD
jgi:hypothetical protein